MLASFLGERILSHLAGSGTCDLNVKKPKRHLNIKQQRFSATCSTSTHQKIWLRDSSVDVLRVFQNLNGSWGKVRYHRICKGSKRFVSTACCREPGIPLKVPHWRRCAFQAKPGYAFCASLQSYSVFPVNLFFLSASQTLIL